MYIIAFLHPTHSYIQMPSHSVIYSAWTTHKTKWQITITIHEYKHRYTYTDRHTHIHTRKGKHMNRKWKIIYLWLAVIQFTLTHRNRKQKQQQEQQSKWYNFLARRNEFLIYITTKKKNKNEIKQLKKWNKIALKILKIWYASSFIREMFQRGRKVFILFCFFHSTFCFITHSLTIWFVRVYECVRWVGVCLKVLMNQINIQYRRNDTVA